MNDQTIMAFIVGAMVGNLFGMFLMGLLVSARDRDDALRAYREYNKAIKRRGYESRRKS